VFKTLFLSFVALISSWVSPLVSQKSPSPLRSTIDQPAEATPQALLAGDQQSSPSVLAATSDSPSKPTFTVNVPSIFTKGITAPNILYSLTGGNGIRVNNTDPQNPIISTSGLLSLNSLTGAVNLTAGDGISVDGLKIKNTGILSLTAGDGISVDGNKITNSGILELTAGDGISIDGNKITNTMPTPDYTLSGWTDGGDIVRLTTTTDSVNINELTTGNFRILNNHSL
jgi:hypothetical protein